LIRIAFIVSLFLGITEGISINLNTCDDIIQVSHVFANLVLL